MYNYVEMRDLVAKRSFLMRKKLDNLLYWLMPSVWIPLYTSVTFSRNRYSKCISNKRWQDDLLTKVIYYVTSEGGLAFAAAATYLLFNKNHYSTANLTGSIDNLTNRLLNKLAN